AQIADMIKDARISTLTTVDADGTLWARPMAIQTDDFAGTLHYFTHVDTEKVAHVEKNPNVAVAFSDPKTQNYVTLAGTASVLNDRAKIAELWSEPMRTWFPEGKDDADLRLLRVDVQRAEYWDSPSSVVVHAYGYVKAVLTGSPPNPGDHGTVEL
ncbi:MAG TPA: pyridoxamine 5'-phosphate oxidase family protein, partial [Rubricoccaceae bacterium]